MGDTLTFDKVSSNTTFELVDGIEDLNCVSHTVLKLLDSGAEYVYTKVTAHPDFTEYATTFAEHIVNAD